MYIDETKINYICLHFNKHCYCNLSCFPATSSFSESSYHRDAGPTKTRTVVAFPAVNVKYLIFKSDFDYFEFLDKDY